MKLAGSRNKIIALGLAVCLAAGLTGCSGGGSEPSPGTTEAGYNSNGEGENENNGGKAPAGSKEDTALHRLANGDQKFSDDKGYYYVTEDSAELRDGAVGKHIMYVDYATRQEVYLCSNAGCTHDTADCTAVLSDAYTDLGGCQLPFLYNGKLYILSKEYNSAGAVTTNYVSDGMSFSSGSDGSSGSAVLYSMDPDGSDRRTAYTFEDGLTVDEAVFADANGIYFVVMKIEMKQMEDDVSSYSAATDRKIVRLDPESGELSTVYDLSRWDEESGMWENWNIVGCTDSCLVLERTKYPDDVTMDEVLDDDAWKGAYGQSNEEYAFLDVSEGYMNVVYSHSNEKNPMVCLHEGMLYYMNSGEDQLWQVELATGEEKLIAQDPSLTDGAIWGVYGDNIHMVTDRESMLWIDLTDGSISHSNLTDRTLGWPVTIKAETPEGFLVIYDYDAEPAELGDGYDIQQNKLALISREDIIAGNADYDPIAMVGKGE